VKLLGERLVAFRDTSGRLGLVDEFYPIVFFWDATRKMGFVVFSMAGNVTWRNDSI
jgi:hypothetical protein